ncbi:unnamed protein product [Clonostachys chloroleuca]|uniref:Carboxylic ester hydrolase n=1 Tax=Clonostachys chloroleuca TaxID=1926264 RepID=A0AA35LSM2_9HYPO|nr:unnamed protein product [Clonostachys chloroleuca]
MQLALLIPLLAAGASAACPTLSVSLEDGIVRGFISSENPDVRQFLGIPYAKPPVGALRFEAPQPIGHFGSVDAKALPPSCPQSGSPLPLIYNRDVLEFNIGGLNGTGATDEDCLTISVWSPAKTAAAGRLPVLLYIYGGGFTSGGEDVPYQTPTQWVQRTQAHVVVSFNYRVGFFGFPSASGLPGTKHNPGLLDQRLAVEWVAKNIAAFGGDPDRIVLWGQSAGGASVASYAYAYPNDPIVKGFIQMSGTEYLLGFSESLSPSSFTTVANRVGCGNLTAAAELECVRLVPWQNIQCAIADARLAGVSLSFGPTPDEKVVFSNYTDRAIRGAVAKLPAILGTTVNDGVALAPWSVEGPSKDLILLYTKLLFLCPAVDAVGRRALAGLPTYRYRYAGNFSNIAPRPWQGAYHSSELPLVFGTHPNYRGNSTAIEYATSVAMQDTWLAFARDGAQGLQKLGWPEWVNAVDNGPIQVFGDGSGMYTGTIDDVERSC